tara:strand:- start:7510 stop:11874 length:4365 start_codon:yes stop_codon:yes gene_type:complete
MASTALTFKLDSSFMTKVKSWSDPYEGNPLGKFVYDRTYSRYKADGTLENWADTCQRVVEGCYTLQQEHIEKHDLGWDKDHGQRSAQEMYERLYHQKFLASGRALWCLGTDVVHQRQLDMALYNCAFISTIDLEKDPSKPFCFLMDVSMLGTGCGADTKGKDKVTIHQPIIPPNQLALNYYTIDDTREGWVDSVRQLLNSYLLPDQVNIIFNYSDIRPEGVRLKTFGGVSSGSKPLEELHGKIRTVLHRDMKKTGKLTSTGIVDIFNLIGVCVVAGNVRRCIPAGTLVHLTRGLVKIEDVRDGDEVITSKGTHPVIGLEEQGEQELVTIHHQLGSTEVSLRHNMKVFKSPTESEFKMAQDVNPGDRLIFSEHLIKGNETKLPSWHYEKPPSSTTCKDLVIPELDSDIAWFIGYFHGDGYTYPNFEKNGFNAYVRFAVLPEETEIIKRCRTQMERFGVNTSIIKASDRDRSIKINAQSKQLAWYLSKFKVANESINIPQEILTAKPNVRAAYLAGTLDADGTTKGRPLQAISSVYPEFVKQLQALYATLGIATRMKLRRESVGNWKTLYNLNIVGKLPLKNFIDRVSEYSVKCQQNPVTNGRPQHDYGFPSQWIQDSDLKYNGKWCKTSTQMTIDKYIECGGQYDGCMPIEVTSIEFEGKQAETYDLAVKDVHEFIINDGLYVSNTAEIMFGEHDDKEFLNLKNYEVNPDRMAWGWSSNNSILAELGMDYTNIAKKIALNGEPGVCYLENMRNYGRMGDPPDGRDKKVLGGNPCFSIDTMIMTNEGIRSFKDLVGKQFVAVVDGKEYPSTEDGIFKTGDDKQLYKMELANGSTIRATENHKFVTPDGLVELKDLSNKANICLSNNTNYKWTGGKGTFDEGYLMGHLLGDGNFGDLQKGSDSIYQAFLDMWIDKSKYESIDDYEPYKFIQDILVNKLTHRNNKNFQGFYMSKETDNYWKVRASIVDVNKMGAEYGIFLHEKKVYEKGSYEFTRGLIQAFFDTDGTVANNFATGKESTLHLSQVHLDRLEAVQRLLYAMGITSTIYKNRQKEGMRMMLDGNGGEKEYYCNNVHQLCISGQSLVTFHNIIELRDNKKRETLESIVGSFKRTPNKGKFISKVKSITKDAVEDVYCCTIPNLHRISVNNMKARQCLEISLESAELCNLVETVPIKHDSLEDFLKTMKYAYLFAKTVTLRSLHWAESSRVVLRNRRIGTSVTGIAQFLGKHNMETLRIWLDSSYKEIRKYDEIYSDWFCIPRSIKVTAIKPSGSLSLLAGTTPGCHYPESRYYIRRVRVANGSHLISGLKEKGFIVEPCVGSEDTTSVVEIPVDIGDVKTLDDVTMWEQVELAAFLQHYYADNQVSCTVTFDPKTEGQHIAAALNTYQYRLKGISFLPRFVGSTAYPQMPYEKISKESYERMIKAQKEVSSVQVAGVKRKRPIYEEMPDAVTFCDGDKCMI